MEPRTPAPITDDEIAPTIFDTRTGDGVVFLDLYEDEYACRYEREHPIEAYRTLSASACAVDIGSKQSLRSAVWHKPNISAHRRPAVCDWIQFGRALAGATFHYRGRTLRQLATVARSLPIRPRCDDLTPGEIADLFEHMLICTPLKLECLFSSFCLLHFLSLYGFRADWIFAVQLFPFRAHCWLAIDDELLNEAPHRIEDYRVIWTVSAAAT
ncbi:lasso peptide biosynthesis B2 protein [Sphingopyxis sp. MG]|uniref:lasso peptide biosynthesis B2 protein n=1 Tax=Sphingopyxis sp. MG TaxID=1866325 RepID=UPI00131A3696|nr:lasso peptide biosynthesis B2 protein [Sphingopyxis sp. MG]